VLRIWVDAISINQNDFSERESQVRLMTQIFRQATDVICDLGEAGDDYLAAMQLAWRRKAVIRGLKEEETILPDDFQLYELLPANDAENMGEYFDEDGNWIGGEETGQEEALGVGAVNVRPRQEEDAEGRAAAENGQVKMPNGEELADALLVARRKCQI
jgi:Heterokaryon incompatibility protein (HET)